MTDAEIFQAAFALIRNPDAWIQTVYAKDSDGCSIAPNSERAVSFCSIGAIAHVLNKEIRMFRTVHPLETMLDVAATEVDFASGSAGHFNDTHTHAEVVALWEKVGKENGWLQ